MDNLDILHSSVAAILFCAAITGLLVVIDRITDVLNSIVQISGDVIF